MNNQEQIIAFLIRGKRAAYAGHGKELESSRRASHDLDYTEENLYYYDTYLGGEQFAGEEGVWQDDKPVWAMNYCGRVTGEHFSGDFLKEALSKTSMGMPYRGPVIYQNGEYMYKCHVYGTFSWFQGQELIEYQDRKIYECYFHGGCIKERA